MPPFAGDVLAAGEDESEGGREVLVEALSSMGGLGERGRVEEVRGFFSQFFLSQKLGAEFRVEGHRHRLGKLFETSHTGPLSTYFRIERLLMLCETAEEVSP